MAISTTPTGSEVCAEYNIPKAGAKGSDFLGKNGLPSSLPLKGSDFIGKSNILYGLTDSFATDATHRKGATAGVYFYQNGRIARYGAHVIPKYTDIGAWVIPSSSSVGNNYQIRFTLLTGSGVSGSGTNTWLRLSQSRSITLSVGLGYRRATVRAELRPYGGGAILDSAVYTLLVEAGEEI
ncbi:hypothetical protein [uncultured Microbulbifer sp.]|uniref:hypothetical protein n=1 Tax=uncultured Microbulbifer sp. TaxID=348147 RepID=UPI00262662F6|nr:hypothetical protein [uncultured Microbulbifer sp.]